MVVAGDEKLTTALLDRLALHATVIPPRGKVIGCGRGAARVSRARPWPGTALGLKNGDHAAGHGPRRARREQSA
jgi:hypothetical protein